MYKSVDIVNFAYVNYTLKDVMGVYKFKQLMKMHLWTENVFTIDADDEDEARRIAERLTRHCVDMSEFMTFPEYHFIDSRNLMETMEPAPVTDDDIHKMYIINDDGS